MANEGIETWAPARVRSLVGTFSQELRLLGVEPSEIAAGTERVAAALSRALTDTRGRWVLSEHSQARSELELTMRVGNTLEHLRLDRTFVESGERWIIDFKTSQHEGADVGEFLRSEVERYAPQLERYARAMRAIDERPICLGLYFPLLAEFRSWRAATEIP
jgi:ATP-dependent exoDNAse (exonuclease V) beta subunit